LDLGLTGKIAIVAASSKGLGRATAATLAAEGALVTINGRDREVLAWTRQEIAVASGTDVLAIHGDMANPTAIEHLVAETVRVRGALDILVCNAGGPPAGTFDSFPEDQPWLDAVNLTLMSTLRLIRTALPHLKQSRTGSITTIVSTSVKQPIPHLILSNTIRTGVIGLTKSLSLELGSQNIRVNNVCPGTTLTDRVTTVGAKRANQEGVSLETILARDAAEIPMGRLGTPEEFGRVVAFIASPAASYVSGVTLQVDGGNTRGLI